MIVVATQLRSQGRLQPRFRRRLGRIGFLLDLAQPLKSAIFRQL